MYKDENSLLRTRVIIKYTFCVNKFCNHNKAEIVKEFKQNETENYDSFPNFFSFLNVFEQAA